VRAGRSRSGRGGTLKAACTGRSEMGDAAQSSVDGRSLLQTRLTNARTEASNRIVKDVAAAPAGSATPSTTAAEYGWSALDANAERQR
jgi:hypothetical protein